MSDTYRQGDIIYVKAAVRSVNDGRVYADCNYNHLSIDAEDTKLFRKHFNKGERVIPYRYESEEQSLGTVVHVNDEYVWVDYPTGPQIHYANDLRLALDEEIKAAEENT